MQKLELKVLNGALAGKRFAVKDGGLRLGRSSTNDIHIADEQLSRNHCLFEFDRDGKLRVTDLASANGTLLNGNMIGDSVVLVAGDVIEVGETQIKVVVEGEAESVPGQVDLGLGENKTAEDTTQRRTSWLNFVYAMVITVLVVGVSAVMLLRPQFVESPAEPKAIAEEAPKLCEVYYEKVEADSEGIFRYEVRLTKDGVLSVAVDDVPNENRHLKKSQPLDERSLAELSEILPWNTIKAIDREYAGAEPDPPALNSWTLRVIYTSRARSIKIVNTQEPELFKTVREKLEVFAKNQLGIWAIQYSRDKLIELAENAIELGRSKWEDRDVQYGNLFEAVMAFKEAIFYLATMDPKPNCIHDARGGLEAAEKELDKRYCNQRFLADRAINLKQWETAQQELKILISMVPDRNDDRNREASAKLIDVEKRITKGRQGR